MNSLITVIEFIFVSNTNAIKPNDLVFSFANQGKEYERENNYENVKITFFPKCQSSKIYYCDLISVFVNNLKLCQFYFLIYIGKKNTIILDLDENGKPSFELFFYTKDSKLNPSTLIYKDKEYNQFENYENKYRSRIFFANVDPTKLGYVNSEIVNKNNLNLGDNTYHAIFRVINDKKFEVSLSDMNKYFDYIEELEPEKIKTEQIGILRELLNKFMIKFWEFYSINLNSDDLKLPTLLIQRKNIYEELKELSQDVAKNDYYYFLQEPKKNKYEYYEYDQNDQNNILNMFYHDYFLHQFLQLDESGYISDEKKFLSIREMACQEHCFIDEIFEKLCNDTNLSLEQKVKILKTVALFLEDTLREKKSIFGVNYINLETISKENPYYKSIELLKKIISNLTEDSRLFEAFLYFDSIVIENVLIKNTESNYKYKDSFGKICKVEQPKFLTEYGISLMKVEEIKKHLMSLLPSVIIIFGTNTKIRALFQPNTNMMAINEYCLFNNYGKGCDIIFKAEPDNYIIPITMEILHEVLGHGKLRYGIGVEEDNYSPLAVRDSKNNFQIQKIIKKVRLFNDIEVEINKGETGRVLEHYISENTEVIQFLKQKTMYKEIINPDYWTGINFDLLHKALKCDNKSTQSNLGNIITDYDSDNECYDCIF